MTLPIIPIPQVGESPVAIFLRASFANGWPSLRALVKAYLGDHPSEDNQFSALVTRPAALMRLVDKMGMDQDWFADNGYRKLGRTDLIRVRWQGLSVPFYSLRLKRPAVCTMCLAADAAPYARSLWDHDAVESCTIHQQMMIYNCPHCRLPLGTMRPAVHLCNCGFDFRRAQGKKASCAELPLINNCISRSDSPGLDTVHQILLTARELAGAGCIGPAFQDHTAFAAEVLSNPSRATHLTAGGNNPLDISSRVVWRRLARRAHCRELLDSVLSALDHAGCYTNRGDFSAALTQIKVTQSEAAAILGVSETAAAKLIKGRILEASRAKPTSDFRIPLSSINGALLRTLPSEPRESADLVPRRLVCERLSQVFRGIDAGRYVSAGYPLTTGLRRLRIWTDHVVLRRAPSGYFRYHDLAAQAGVFPEAIRCLLKVGFLPHERRNATLLISKHDAKTFLDTYIFGCAVANSLGYEPRRFSDRLMASGYRAYSGPTIDGAVLYLFRRSDIERADLAKVSRLVECMFSREPYGSRSRRLENSRYVSYADAAVTLGVSVQRISRLVRRGHLTGNRSMPDGHRGLAVSKKSLSKLLSALNAPWLITVEKASAGLGETVHEFRRRWVQTGVVQERDYEIKRLVRVSDLKRVRLLKARGTTRSDYGKSTDMHRSHAENLRRAGYLAGWRVGGGPGLRLYCDKGKRHLGP